MEKKVVCKELYDCLNYLVKLKGKEWIIAKHAIKIHLNKTSWISEDFIPLNGLTVDDLADLLYNGYRFEETKEEKLLREYNKYDPDVCFYILKALETLDIKIEGINK